ncbi:MAG TPA: type II toxin-antitoxin system VapC family toxin [Herpetosiphonaceae bacterium]
MRSTKPARQIIESPENGLFVSIASIWEMAIKVSLGKLHLSQPFDLFVTNQLMLNDIGILDISISHTLRVATLPLHHRDPFDRLIVAQSQTESLPLISADSLLDPYDITRIW